MMMVMMERVVNDSLSKKLLHGEILSGSKFDHVPFEKIVNCCENTTNHKRLLFLIFTNPHSSADPDLSYSCPVVTQT